MPKIHAGAGAVGMNPKQPRVFHGQTGGEGFCRISALVLADLLLSLSAVDCGCFSPKLAK